jgi:DNA-binding response OmpR family regulator
MNILVIEDEPLMADFLKRGLSAEGHIITLARDGFEGQAYATSDEYDVILLDVMLPGRSGIDVCETIRDAGVASPVIMLSAMDSVADRIRGLRAGADDYVVKPYSFDELIARIDGLASRKSRGGQQSRSKTLLSHGSIALDRETVRVSRSGNRIDLTAKEFGILELLLERPGTVVSRERILNTVWGIHSDPLTNVVEVYIGRLRRKLDEFGPLSIETVRGFGYRMAENQDAPATVTHTTLT